MILPRSQSGFSLVETLVAITVLLLVIVGPMSISSSAARSTSYSSEQVVAFFLAQEGAELVQKARDDLQLQNFAGSNATPWNDFSSGSLYSDCFVSGAGCGLELQDGDANGSLETPINCGLTSCQLYINNSGGRSRYTHDSTGTETQFTRVIEMSATAGREVEVISTVSWQPDNQRRRQTVEVKTYLFNVYDN
jgi:prepilin-type N-terminal cleavage/methylation domain-containing protein